MYWWAEEACRLQVQVNVGGRIVHPGGGSTRRIEVNSQIWFRVRWQERLYPNAGSGCEGTGNACTVVAGESGATFVCDLDMATTAVLQIQAICRARRR